MRIDYNKKEFTFSEREMVDVLRYVRIGRAHEAIAFHRFIKGVNCANCSRRARCKLASGGQWSDSVCYKFIPAKYDLIGLPKTLLKKEL